MKKYFKIAFYGLLTWFVPFVVSFFFYTKDGVLTIEEGLFKSIMVVTGALTGTVLLVLYFKKISDNYLQKGLLVGFIWLSINLVLDFLILIPMSHMTVPAYLSQIGLRYLIIPIVGIAMGYILALHEENAKKISRR